MPMSRPRAFPGNYMRLSKYLMACTAAVSLTLAFGAASAMAKTFALVTINQQALFFNQINDGAKAAAKTAGADLVIFSITTFRAPRTTRDRELHHPEGRRHHSRCH